MFNWLFGPTRTQQILADIRARGPLTEIEMWEEWPDTLVDEKLFDMRGRPTLAKRGLLIAALWPRPDPSKRWRLFIQEDTRPQGRGGTCHIENGNFVDDKTGEVLGSAEDTRP